MKWLPMGGSDICNRADFITAAHSEVAVHPKSARSYVFSGETLARLACYKSCHPCPLSCNVGKCLMLAGLISCTTSWRRTNTNLGSVLTLGIQVALC